LSYYSSTKWGELGEGKIYLTGEGCRGIKRTVYFFWILDTFIFFDHSWQSVHTNTFTIKNQLPFYSSSCEIWKYFAHNHETITSSVNSQSHSTVTYSYNFTITRFFPLFGSLYECNQCWTLFIMLWNTKPSYSRYIVWQFITLIVNHKEIVLDKFRPIGGAHIRRGAYSRRGRGR